MPERSELSESRIAEARRFLTVLGSLLQDRDPKVREIEARINETTFAALDAVTTPTPTRDADFQLGYEAGLKFCQDQLAANEKLLGLMTEDTANDTERLNLLLAGAHLCPTEDGETLGLYLSDKENELAALIVASASDDEEGYFTREDVPFLSDDQRNHLNGVSASGPWKWASDPQVIRKAIDATLVRLAMEIKTAAGDLDG